MGRDFLSKYFGHAKIFYVKLLLLTRNSNQGSMSDRYHLQKKTRLNEIFTRFQRKLMVFEALTNCFRKIIFYVILEFHFHLLSFLQLNDLLSPKKDPVIS